MEPCKHIVTFDGTAHEKQYIRLTDMMAVPLLAVLASCASLAVEKWSMVLVAMGKTSTVFIAPMGEVCIVVMLLGFGVFFALKTKVNKRYEEQNAPLIDSIMRASAEEGVALERDEAVNLLVTGDYWKDGIEFTSSCCHSEPGISISAE